MKSYYLLYLPGIIFLLMPLMNAVYNAVRADRERCRKAEQAALREAERQAAMEQHKAEQAAANEAAKAAAVAAPKAQRGRPRKEPKPESKRPEIIPAKPEAPAKPAAKPANPAPAVAPAVAPAKDPAPAPAPDPAPAAPVVRPIVIQGNNAFLGECVSFTGTLPGMLRKDAIKAVRENGGRAFETMPAFTTLLVVGEKPGRNKLQQANNTPGCRTIPAAHFFALLHQPLTFDPEGFKAFCEQRLAHNHA